MLRKLTHGINGMFFAILVYLFSIASSIFFFSFLLLATLFFSEVNKAERKEIGKGAKWYFCGVLFNLIIFGLIDIPKEIIASAMIIVALGDSFCSLGRVLGKRRLPKTISKTLEGTIFGILFSFIGAFAFLLLKFNIITSLLLSLSGSIAGMLAEAYLIKPDDNFTITVLSCSVMAAIYFSM